MAQIFISYSHSDAEFAENLKHRLDQADFEVWMDEERLRAGEDWREEIDDAIGSAFALVLVMTPASMNSQYVMYEWAFAWGIQVKVIPLLLQDIGKDGIHPRLDKRQYLNFTDPTNGQQWDKLIERLKEVKYEHSISPRVPRDAPPEVREAILNLNQWNSGVRRAAIDYLADADHRAARDALIFTLRNSNHDDARCYTAQTLGRLKEQAAVSPLIEALYSENSDLRLYAAEALGSIGESNAISDLAKLLHDPVSDVRKVAVEALIRIDTEAALRQVVTALGDTEWTVRQTVIRALAQTKNTVVIPALKKVSREDENEVLRRDALATLSAIET